MANIKLPYGKTILETVIPDYRINKILELKAYGYVSNMSETELIDEALANPIESPPLKELVKGKNNIVLIASDHTRPVPSKLIMPSLLKEIHEGNPEAKLTILIATGFHRLTTKEELIDKFGEVIVNNPDIQFIIHESGKTEDFVNIGILPSGGELIINRYAAQADLLISEGFIEPHFFAGFSGGRKSVLPGICSRSTVMANHCSEFIADPHSRSGILEGNPLHKDMLYAAEKAKLAFIVNVVLDNNKKVIKAFAGHYNEAHQVGCAFVEDLCGVDASPADIVISTNGGYPLDQNVYQTVKGMVAAEFSCKPGGIIIMVSSCVYGHGGQDLYDTFTNEKSLQAIMDDILARKRGETVPDQWESQILCRILLKHRVIMVTQAPEKLITDMQMEYAKNLQEAIAKADTYLGKSDSKITIIPDGVSVIVR
ncbi:MAG: putative D-mannonate dehydrogenase [Herbinix sp.]|nr:putative D-mannonate dehydrogenase [Herbinix sp.]